MPIAVKRVLVWTALMFGLMAAAIVISMMQASKAEADVVIPGLNPGTNAQLNQLLPEPQKQQAQQAVDGLNTTDRQNLSNVASLVPAPPTPAQPVFVPEPQPAVAEVQWTPESIPTVPAPQPAAAPGFSIPMATQEIVDPIYGAGLKLVNPNYFVPEKEQYAASDPLPKQIDDTVQMFTVQTVTADRGRCGEDMTFADKAACGSAIVDDNNGVDGVAPVQVTGRNVPFVVNSINPMCGAMPYGTNYCRSDDMPEGVIHLSKPAMNNMSGTGGYDAPLGDITGVLAHENGHRADDYAFEARGEDFNEFIKGEGNTLIAENSADRHSGTTLQNAVNNGDLTVAELENYIQTIRKVSDASDPTHGGPDMREGEIRLGMAA